MPTKINEKNEKLETVKVLKRCPICHATRFQGPFPRGEIMGNGVFVRFEELYNCMGCHKVLSIGEMEDLEVPSH